MARVITDPDVFEDAQMFDDLLDPEGAEPVVASLVAPIAESRSRSGRKSEQVSPGVNTFYGVVGYEFDLCEKRSRWTSSEVRNWLGAADAAWKWFNDHVLRLGGISAASTFRGSATSGSSSIGKLQILQPAPHILRIGKRFTPLRLMFTALMSYINIATVVNHGVWRMPDSPTHDADLLQAYSEGVQSLLATGAWDADTVIENLDRLGQYAAELGGLIAPGASGSGSGSGGSAHDGNSSSNRFRSIGETRERVGRGALASANPSSRRLFARGASGATGSGGIARPSGSGDSAAPAPLSSPLVGPTRGKSLGGGNSSGSGSHQKLFADSLSAAEKARWVVLARICRIVKVIFRVRLGHFHLAVEEASYGSITFPEQAADALGGGILLPDLLHIPCASYLQRGGVLGQALLYHLSFALLMLGRFSDSVTLITYYLMALMRERGTDRDPLTEDVYNRTMCISQRFAESRFGSYPVFRIVSLAYMLSPVVRYFLLLFLGGRGGGVFLVGGWGRE